MSEKHEDNLCLSRTAAYGRHNTISIEMIWFLPALVHKEMESMDVN